jgi:hypothetical protein
MSSGWKDIDKMPSHLKDGRLVIIEVPLVGNPDHPMPKAIFMCRWSSYDGCWKRAPITGVESDEDLLSPPRYGHPTVYLEIPERS